MASIFGVWIIHSLTICIIMFGIGSAHPGIFEREAAKLGGFGVWRVLGLGKLWDFH